MTTQSAEQGPSNAPQGRPSAGRIPPTRHQFVVLDYIRSDKGFCMKRTHTDTYELACQFILLAISASSNPAALRIEIYDHVNSEFVVTNSAVINTVRTLAAMRCSYSSHAANQGLARLGYTLFPDLAHLGAFGLPQGPPHQKNDADGEPI
jgi:hypothetical protein